MASVYPSGFCANMTVLIKGPRGFAGSGRSLSGDLIGFVAGYAVMVVVVGLMRPHQIFGFHLPSFPPLLVLAPLAGIACIAAEYVVGVLIVSARTKRLVTRVVVHSSYSRFARISGKDVLSILALVILEEMVLRQLLYKLLADDLAMSAGVCVGLCAVVYALNHLSFGVASAIAKLPSGLIYSALFWLSGLSILVVILAHATQNLTLLAIGRSKR